MRTSNPRSPGLPQRLQHLADLAGTVTALAQRGGCSRKTLQNWLTGTLPVNRSGLLRLAQNLGIPEVWLTDGVGEPPSQLGSAGRQATETVPLLDVSNPKAVTFLSASVEWLHYAFGLRPEEVVWWHSTDAAMWPEIAIGMPVLLRRIDPIIPGIRTDRLLLVRYQGKEILRVVSLDHEYEEGVVLGAWNPNRFPPIRAALKDLEGIGELLFSGRSWSTELSEGLAMARSLRKSGGTGKSRA